MSVFQVHGDPTPQGSKRAFIRGGKAVVVEQQDKRVQSWRKAVIDAADGTGYTDGPVSLHVLFYLRRPKAHYGTGRNAGQVRDSAPPFPAVMPDLDKLLRSTTDALTAAGCWRDDAQVITVTAGKYYADGIPPGATISITAATDTPERNRF